MKAATREFQDGVQLTKYAEKDEYALPSVVYEFTSERREAVTVSVVESIAKAVEPEHLGFHRDFEPGNWTVTDEELVFEAEIDPESSLQTVCALRPNASVEPEQLLASPEEFSVTPAREALVRGATSESVSRSVSASGIDDTEPTEEASIAGESTADEQGQEGETVAEEKQRDADDEADTSLEPVTSTVKQTQRQAQAEGSSLADRFVSDLQSGRVSDDSLDYLEQQFDTAPDKSGSMDARITQLQREFADLRAYTSALEEFLDDNGSGQELVNSVESRLESVDAELDSLESTVDEHGTEMADVRDALKDVESEVESVSAKLGATAEDVEELSAQVDRIDDQLPEYDVDERFAELEDNIAGMTEFTSTLQDAFTESFVD